MALPSSYYIAVALLAILLLHGTVRMRAAWSFPYNAALATVGAWYLIEPVYFPQEFTYFSPRHMEMAFDSVVIYLLAFALATPVLVKKMQPGTAEPTLSFSFIPAERVLAMIVAMWLVLLAYGVFRLQGDVIGALFPLGGRAGARMWGRAAGAGAGDAGFIVSTASYLYVLCLASFGVLFFIVRNRRYRAFVIALIFISWPYAFLQGARNVTLAVIVPAALCYLLFSQRSRLTKVIVLGLSFMAVEFAMRVIIQYRNEGFQHIDLSKVEQTTHLGLNMASELVYSTEFVDRGILQLAYGRHYIEELLNVIPRALWSDKPVLGVEYALARGFGDATADIGVFVTISPGVIGQGVQNFGNILGPIVPAILMATWVGLLSRFRWQATPLRISLFLIGLGLTFNLGRGITLLVLWPMVFAYLGVRAVEFNQRRRTRKRGRITTRAPVNAQGHHHTRASPRSI